MVVKEDTRVPLHALSQIYNLESVQKIKQKIEHFSEHLTPNVEVRLEK